MKTPLFTIGRHVRHKLGNQVMIVIEYKKAHGPINFGSRQNNYSEPKYTGQILCGWVDANNMPQRAIFEESELEEVN